MKASLKDIKDQQDYIINFYEQHMDEHVIFMLSPEQIASYHNNKIRGAKIRRWFSEGKIYKEMEMKDRLKQRRFRYHCYNFLLRWEELCEKQKGKLHNVIMKDALGDGNDKLPNPKLAMELLKMGERGSLNEVHKSEVNINKNETRHILIENRMNDLKRLSPDERKQMLIGAAKKLGITEMDMKKNDAGIFEVGNRTG